MSCAPILAPRTCLKNVDDQKLLNMFHVGLQVQIKSGQSLQFSVPPSTVRFRPRTMELTPILVPRTRCGFLAQYSFGFIFLRESILPRYSTLSCGDLDFTLASSFLLTVTWCDPTSLNTFISDYQTLFYVKKQMTEIRKYWALTFHR